MRRSLLFTALLVLLIRLPFLNQAIQGDDIYYLEGAQHAQIDPPHPNHARYVFLGQMIDMRGHPHPPLNAWVLAALLAAFGDVYEMRFHAAYLLFSLLAAISMLSLAHRFSPRPLLATMLFIATPAFIVNGNSLEADVPFLSFWIAATALFIRAVDSRSTLRLLFAAAALSFAALAAYQSALLVPILALYLWMKRRDWLPAWAVVFVVPAVLIAWQAWERAATGEIPLSVLNRYFADYGLQALTPKLRNAAALTAHSAWLIFPALAVAAFRRAGRGPWIVVLAAAAAAAAIDPHPLFWASFAIGALILAWSGRSILKAADNDTRFLAAWVLLFFAGALVLFFAGSARYLLPVAAPMVLLAARALEHRPRWLATGFALQLAFSLSLAYVNYRHWDGYRDFAGEMQEEIENRRVWINGEWGLRFYCEAYGGLPLRLGQAVQPGEMVISSELAFPISFTTGGGVLAPVAERQIRTSVPLRIVGIGAHSAYSTAALGLRPFDFSKGLIDRVRAQVVIEQKPTLSYLPMNAPEAGRHIVSGAYQLESNRWRWMGERAVFLLKPPPKPSAVAVAFHISEQAPARRVTVTVNGARAAEQTYARPGTYTLVSEPVAVSSDTATVVVTVDKTFSVPGDHRQLGVVLTEVGFR